MLEDIRTSLEHLVADYALISPDEVDVRHDPPTREFVERLTRPTISFYLFDLHENTDLRAPGMHTFRGASEAVKRFAPRRIDLHLMVSALTSEVADEDALLWRLLSTFLKHAEWPDEITPASVRGFDLPVSARVEHKHEVSQLADLWGGLSARPRPSLWYVVTVPLDLEVEVIAPLVLTRISRILDKDSGHEMKSTIAITGMVKRSDGSPVAEATVSIDGHAGGAVQTAADGRFVLRNLGEGPLKLSVSTAGGRTRRVTLHVPAESYDIVVD